jgi:hypothetical protein
MRWGDDQDAGLLAFYRALLRLRARHPRAGAASGRSGWPTMRRLLVVEVGVADDLGRSSSCTRARGW